MTQKIIMKNVFRQQEDTKQKKRATAVTDSGGSSEHPLAVSGRGHER
jgi:hypothetical protein